MSFVERVKSRLKRDAQSKKRMSSRFSTPSVPTPPQTSISELHETPRVLPDSSWDTEDKNADSKPGTASIKPAHSPISSVWSEAWDELGKSPETAALAQRYESQLLESAATSLPPGSVLPYGKHEQLRFLIERQTEEVEKNEWKLRFQGYDFKVKALIEPAVAVTQCESDIATNFVRFLMYMKRPEASSEVPSKRVRQHPWLGPEYACFFP